MIIFIFLKAALLFGQERPLFRVRFLWIRNLVPAKLVMHECKTMTEEYKVNDLSLLLIAEPGDS